MPHGNGPETLTLSADHGAPLVSLRDGGSAASPGRRIRAPKALRRHDDRAPFVQIAVLHSLDEAESVWRQFEMQAPVSPYQTFAWTRAWMETDGAEAGVRPLIGVAIDRRGQIVALMPLGVTQRGRLAIVGFLGGRHANYNLGLFDPAVAWTAAGVRRLLRSIAAASPLRVDLFALVNQPLEWDGWHNPLALLPHQASPSDSHRAVLEPDGEAFLAAHLSAAARKKQRSKARALEALGPVAHVVARSPDAVEALLDAHVAQKASKLAVIGAGVDEAGLARTRRLFAAAAAGPAPALELHGLTCGERIVATFGGLMHRGRFSGLMISHDDEPTFARLSPGEILLAEVIKAKCAEGLSSFDLGIGEARYKQSLCPIADPLIDSLVPTSLPGHVFVLGEAVRLRLKRAVKQSAWAWPLALRLRRLLAARRAKS